jgi:hypothetical protein
MTYRKEVNSGNPSIFANFSYLGELDANFSELCLKESFLLKTFDH